MTCTGCGQYLRQNERGLWTCDTEGCPGRLSTPKPRTPERGYVEDPIRRDPLWMILLSLVLGPFVRRGL